MRAGWALGRLSLASLVSGRPDSTRRRGPRVGLQRTRRRPKALPERDQKPGWQCWNLVSSKPRRLRSRYLTSCRVVYRGLFDCSE
ncbi:hypothetical protein F5Y16DRAFT_135318 [Xylariaceae sp. FL0255]|nr:hypothetical protein F5Y16DRAFT_135318 [Xylariaceae sp. FL0255]